jgi:hypothetical protein
MSKGKTSLVEYVCGYRAALRLFGTTKRGGTRMDTAPFFC